MTIAREAPMDAACRLAANALRNGFNFEPLHTYTNREAIPLYWRIRAKHPATGKKWIRPMKLTGNGYELGEPEKPANGKPLYRLHELVSRPDDVVIVTEGELKADQLAALGLLVTTSGAADSAGEADWQALAGRDVLIWRDNDKSGRHYADAVLAALRPLGCKVKVIDVDLLGLAPKGDAVDWLASPERLSVAGTTRDTGHHSRFAPRSSFWPPRHAALAPIALAAASRFIGLSPCPRALGAPEGASADVARRERAGCRSRCTVCGFDAR